MGGQGHYWFGDHVRLGLTANSNEEGDADSKLGAADLTLRMSTDSFLKVQSGAAKGSCPLAAVRRRRVRVPPAPRLLVHRRRGATAPT